MLHVRLRRCCVALLAVSLALGLLMPSRGYAIEINWSGTEHPNHTRVSNGDGTNSFAVWDFRPPVGETLACANGFDAAAWSMGTIGFDPRNLSALERAYLSDASRCPNFCAFADSFHNSGPGVDIGLPGGVVIPGGYAWVSDNYPSDAYSSAVDEFNRIKSGDYPSGGVSGGSDFQCYFPFSFRTYGKTDSDKAWNYVSFYSAGNVLEFTSRMKRDGTADGGVLLSSPFAVSVPAGSLPEYPSSATDLVPAYTLSFSGSTASLYVALVRDSSLANEGFVTNSTSDISKSFSVCVGSYTQVYSCTLRSSDYSLSAGGVVFNTLSNSPSWASTSGTYTWAANSNSLRGFGLGSASEPPEGPWTPGPTVEPPESPDVPEPDPPVSPEPDPPVVTQPTLPDPPSNPTVPVEPVTPEPEPTGTSPQDYTPWLRAILNALNRLDSSLASHCQHLQQRMHTEMLWWYNAFTQWFNPVYIAFCQFLNDWAVYFDDLLEGTLDEQTYEMEQWLRELFVWLADQFEFTFTGSPVTVEPGEGGDSGTVTFDDSSIVYWLKMIYNAIQDLDISPTTKPDIGSDANGFWEWLNAILAGIVAGLVAGILGVIAGFTDAIDALTDKFPFSLPWDIAAMLALLAHDPVTPVFDLPLASPDGTVVDCHVDMSDWDGVMANVRAMELLLFGLALAKRTPDMIDAVKDIF